MSFFSFWDNNNYHKNSCIHTYCTDAHTHQLALTCPLSTYSVVAALYISLSNHLLRPRGPELPSVRPVSYEVRSVFITSVKATPFTLSCQPLWRAAALLSNLDIISRTCSDYTVSWTDTAVYHLSVTAWPKTLSGNLLSHATLETVDLTSCDSFSLWIMDYLKSRAWKGVMLVEETVGNIVIGLCHYFERLKNRWYL